MTTISPCDCHVCKRLDSRFPGDGKQLTFVPPPLQSQAAGYGTSAA